MGAARSTWLPLALLALSLVGCTGTGTRGRPAVAYEASALHAELVRRVGSEAADELGVPFEVSREALDRARRDVLRSERGRGRIERLATLLMRDPPDGFGLRYRWSATAGAPQTLATGEGNCMALASVLIGLARGLGWGAYYAEAGEPAGESVLAAGIGVLADHMVVVIEAEGERAVVDFLGAVERGSLRIIDDLGAVAHLVNNRAFEQIVAAQERDEAIPWDAVRARFELATRIDPGSARAWNNLGIALAREGRVAEARRAYVRARMLDARLSSPENNLAVLQTRLSGAVEPAVAPVDP